MKVSIITVVYNGEKYIKNCIDSVLSQDYLDIEYIIVDGASTDKTLGILASYKDQVHDIVSEKDAGMYDALNKGVEKSSGDIIGILNADDMLASNDVITDIVRCFKENSWADGLYGHLNYVDPRNISKVIRNWIAKPYTRKDLELGWMPAHPTLYLKKEMFRHYGNYSLDFGSAADYELIVRFLYLHEIKLVFLDKLIVNMRNGGMSNASLRLRLHALINDFRALKKNEMPFPLRTLLVKKLSKISQFYRFKKLT